MNNQDKLKEIKEYCEKVQAQNLNFLKSTKPFYVERYDYYESKVDLTTEILKLLEENNG
tara:strand:+ start:294 stop:470 length:177 start_codon:yes stop_codon:yes gene_type:complete